MTVAVDLGSGAVKVATDAGATIRLVPPVDPELAARVGTSVPLIRRDGDLVITQAPHDAYVRAVATSLNGTTAASVAIVTPDWWTPRARALVEQTFEAHEPGRFQLVSPAAAAISAASESHRLPSTVAVLDIGAESSSSTILDEDDGVHRVVGRPAVLHGQAGNQIDRRLMQLVLGWLSPDVQGYEPTGAEIAAAGQSLQTQVKAAKERLSTRPVATVTPHLPGANVELRLVRSEFDEVVRETVDAIVAMLKANIVVNSPEGVGAVMLTGGSVSIPLVTQVISAELGLPVILENDPATLAVRGAAPWRCRHPRSAAGGFPAADTQHVSRSTWRTRRRQRVNPGSIHPRSQRRRRVRNRRGDMWGVSPLWPRSTTTRGDGWTASSTSPGARLRRRSRSHVRRRLTSWSRQETRLAPTQSARWASAPESESSWNSARRVYVDDHGHLRRQDQRSRPRPGPGHGAVVDVRHADPHGPAGLRDGDRDG